MLIKPPLLAALLLCSITLASPLRAQETSPDPSKILLEDANTLIDDLRKNQTFNQYERSGALYAQNAALRFSTRPNDALYFARDIKEPFYASLALAAIAAQYIKSDPDLAYQLILGAQERALSINHYSGSDATSLNYIFELNTLFDPTRAKSLLTASRRNLKQWLGDGSQKSKPMLVLAQQTITFDPAKVESLLNEATADRWIQPHLYESVQLLGTHLAHTKKEWAADQVAAFYKSGKSWPQAYDVLQALLLDDALRDPPAALKKIDSMAQEDQDQARFYVALALRDAGRSKESFAIIDDLQARIDAKAPGSGWITGVLPPVKERWAADEERAKNPSPGPIGAPQIDKFITTPDSMLFRSLPPQGQFQFRNRQQAAQFITAALPVAKSIVDMGYPHHGSPRSAALGTLAQIAALANDPAQAKVIADEITIPELRTFYLLNAYEVFHPLPTSTHGWPIFFYSRTNIQIGPPPAR